MIAIVCLDDRKGMLFNGRRQSRDRAVVDKILELTKGKCLWIHPFSEPLFVEKGAEHMAVDAHFLEKAGEGDFCFVENCGLAEVAERLEGIIVFWWNRHYPSDLRLDIRLEDWTKAGAEEFAGFSHEKITKEVYTR